MPAAAPATSRQRRSAAVRCSSCPITLPTAPPVTMIGPSAPNGPPVPMLTALEIGLSTASRGSIRLPRNRIVSIASGMPCPRMRSDPTRAMSPMTSPPATGTRTLSGPRREVSGRSIRVPSVPVYTACVIRPMRSSSPSARKATATPIAIAIAASQRTAGGVVKSRRSRSAAAGRRRSHGTVNPSGNRSRRLEGITDARSYRGPIFLRRLAAGLLARHPAPPLCQLTANRSTGYARHGRVPT